MRSESGHEKSALKLSQDQLAETSQGRNWSKERATRWPPIWLPSHAWKNATRPPSARWSKCGSACRRPSSLWPARSWRRNRRRFLRTEPGRPGAGSRAAQSTKLEDFQKGLEAARMEQAQGKGASAERPDQQAFRVEYTRFTDQANNLASALRGSSKAQGAWGELILERVLQAAGLRAGTRI